MNPIILVWTIQKICRAIEKLSQGYGLNNMILAYIFILPKDLCLSIRQ
jgi:hypothetical protein